MPGPGSRAARPNTGQHSFHRSFRIKISSSTHLTSKHRTTLASRFIVLLRSPSYIAQRLSTQLVTMAAQQEHDALVASYRHLREMPRGNDALYTLKKIASIVKPIMRARGWRVSELCEFYPSQENLLGMTGKLLRLSSLPRTD